MNARTRLAAVLLAVVAIGASAAVGYRYETQHSPKPPLVGVVHETEIRIAPDASGRLKALAVTPGQPVRKGDKLAELSDPETAASLAEAGANLQSARANLANVEAGVRQEELDTARQSVEIAASNLELARQQFARVSTLTAHAFASRQQYDEDAAALAEAEASLNQAQAALAESKAGPTKEQLAIARSQVALSEATVADVAAQLAKTTLTAPADGVARLVVAEPGEAIVPGQPVLTMGLASDRWFSFTIREDRLAGVTIGSKLALRTVAGDRLKARVTELRPLGEFAVWRAARAVGDHDLNAFLLRADPIGPTPGLEPGMTVWIDEAAMSPASRS
ncbi:HlyD family secretion protein [Roseiarcus sp.]|uniref:HlyD family secretion protein n=1 Tax=Roseiarcus sp. TaxID=1969460 RepID=UPI003F9A03B7